MAETLDKVQEIAGQIMDQYADAVIVVILPGKDPAIATEQKEEETAEIANIEEDSNWFEMAFWDAFYNSHAKEVAGGTPGGSGGGGAIETS